MIGVRLYVVSGDLNMGDYSDRDRTSGAGEWCTYFSGQAQPDWCDGIAKYMILLILVYELIDNVFICFPKLIIRNLRTKIYSMDTADITCYKSAINV